jgi:glycosyltransferase involved in cell wall biosynthesis
VAIICKNSEATIGRTLDSVRGLAAEIVAVDSGSTDGTIPLLERHGARVIKSAWLGYGKTKQVALEACTQEWVLALDSDESVEPLLAASIRANLSGGAAQHDAFELNRKVFYDGRFLDHAWQPEWRLRMVRRTKGRWTPVDPHESLELIDRPSASARTGRLGGDLRHDSFVTFAEQLRKQVGYAELAAKAEVAKGRSGSYWKLLTSPGGAFLKQLVLKQAFRDGWPGWLAAAATAQQALMKHAMTIELARKRK